MFSAVMPLFTAQNASEMAKRSHAPDSARNRKPEPAAIAPHTAQGPADSLTETLSAHKKQVEEQIAQADKFLSECDNPMDFMRLTKAKESLWKMIYPFAGVLRPKQGRGNKGLSAE